MIFFFFRVSSHFFLLFVSPSVAWCIRITYFVFGPTSAGNISRSMPVDTRPSGTGSYKTCVAYAAATFSANLRVCCRRSCAHVCVHYVELSFVYDLDKFKCRGLVHCARGAYRFGFELYYFQFSVYKEQMSFKKPFVDCLIATATGVACTNSITTWFNCRRGCASPSQVDIRTVCKIETERHLFKCQKMCVQFSIEHAQLYKRRAPIES